MNDLDVVREMRARVKAPTPARLARGRARLLAAMSGADTSWNELQERRMQGRRPAAGPPRQGRRLLRRSWLAAGVCAAAAMAVLVAVVLPGSPGLTRPLHIGWQPARPLPRGVLPPDRSAPAGTWRLASYLVPAGWQLNTAGPEPGSLTCPTAATCYVLGNSAAAFSYRPDMNSFYASNDGGRSWSVLPVAAGIQFTSALSCASAENCAAGATYHGQPVFAVTADGGHSWTIDPLPAGYGPIFQLTCLTATTCRGLAAPAQPAFVQFHTDVRFVSTSDAGAHFTASVFPAGAAMQTVSCPTVSRCVAIGLPGSFDNKKLVQAVAATSNDGGATWSPAALPRGLSIIPVWAPLTCVSESRCFLLCYINWQDPRRGVSDLAVSQDGGRTWTERNFPASVPDPQLASIACPGEATCYVAGSYSAPGAGQDAVNADTSTVLVTRDGGVTWDRIALPGPSHGPSGWDHDAYISVGDMQCPQVSTCIALAAADQGAKSVPVYTNAP
ncbi:MAG: hypothetical protein JO242_24295 [Streptosporangiaceae bacterium]|nr:hypothetical protein [Streptosporangiaceae bacterium]